MVYEHVILHLIYFISTLIKNGVVDDGVPAILHYRSSDLYLADSKETMMVEVGNNHDCRFLLKYRNEFKFSSNCSGSIDIWNALECWYE